jgi:hypothetical protein
VHLLIGLCIFVPFVPFVLDPRWWLLCDPRPHPQRFNDYPYWPRPSATSPWINNPSQRLLLLRLQEDLKTAWGSLESQRDFTVSRVFLVNSRNERKSRRRPSILFLSMAVIATGTYYEYVCLDFYFECLNLDATRDRSRLAFA